MLAAIADRLQDLSFLLFFSCCCCCLSEKTESDEEGEEGDADRELKKKVTREEKKERKSRKGWWGWTWRDPLGHNSWREKREEWERKRRDRRHAGYEGEQAAPRATTWFFFVEFALSVSLRRRREDLVRSTGEARSSSSSSRKKEREKEKRRMDRKSIKEGKLAVQTLICLYFLASFFSSHFLNLSLWPFFASVSVIPSIHPFIHPTLGSRVNRVRFIDFFSLFSFPCITSVGVGGGFDRVMQ